MLVPSYHFLINEKTFSFTSKHLEHYEKEPFPFIFYFLLWSATAI